MKFNFKYILMSLFVCLLALNSTFFASEKKADEVTQDSLASAVKKSINDTNFNGSVMISKNNVDNYDVLYEGAVGTDGGYDIDTLYDIGSISKLYTTIAIMLLQEDGKLDYSDTIDQYIDGVPSDKQDVTIQMLLTHTSGIYVDENEDHSVSKETELKRILNNDLAFTPGTNYKYSNAGFTLLAAIIESASGETYEDYLTENLFDPLGLESTGFPDSEYLDDLPAVSGELDGVDYGIVTDFDFGWYSKGYTDILTTPRELTYFFQAVASGKVINKENMALMGSNQMDIGNDTVRGYGTYVKHSGTDEKIVGHLGIWYGGNSVVYYRPSDQILFVMTCDEVNVSYDFPANSVFNTLTEEFTSGTLSDVEAVETVDIEDLITEEIEPAVETISAADTSSESEVVSETKSTNSFKEYINSIMNNIVSNKVIIQILIVLVILIIVVEIIIIKTTTSSRSRKMPKKKEKSSKDDNMKK